MKQELLFQQQQIARLQGQICRRKQRYRQQEQRLNRIVQSQYTMRMREMERELVQFGQGLINELMKSVRAGVEQELQRRLYDEIVQARCKQIKEYEHKYRIQQIQKLREQEEYLQIAKQMKYIEDKKNQEDLLLYVTQKELIDKWFWNQKISIEKQRNQVDILIALYQEQALSMNLIQRPDRLFNEESTNKNIINQLVNKPRSKFTGDNLLQFLQYQLNNLHERQICLRQKQGLQDKSYKFQVNKLIDKKKKLNQIYSLSLRQKQISSKMIKQYLIQQFQQNKQPKEQLSIDKAYRLDKQSCNKDRIRSESLYVQSRPRKQSLNNFYNFKCIHKCQKYNTFINKYYIL